MAYEGSPDECKQVQYDVLTYKIDKTTNSKMVYNSNAILNKGLNPDYFTGNDTKIVNALNKLYKMIVKCNTTAERVSEKYNPIVLDTELAENKPILEAMRKATGKDTLIESVLALAKGEVGGLAVLNPTDAEDGFVVTFDKQQNKFVLKPPTEAIEQNLVLFNSQTEKDKYITLDNCKVGQVGYFNNEYYRVAATSDTKQIISKKANYVIHKNKTVSADLSITNAENISLIDAAANFVLEVRDIEINKTYTLVLDKDASVSVTPVSSKGNSGTSAHTMTTDKKLEFSTADGTVTKIYVDIASSDNSGTNDVNARVATEFATVPVCEWKPLVDLSYKKTEGTLVEVGGAPKGYVPNGSIADMLDAVLYPEVAPKITLTPQAHQVLVLEKGVGYTQNVKFDLSFEKTKNKIEKIVMMRNGVETDILDSTELESMPSPIAYTYKNDTQDTDPTTVTRIEETSTFKAKIVDIKGLESESKEVTIDFVEPIFVGSASAITDDIISSELLVDGNKQIVKKSNIKATYTHENLISMIAYPETYGDLVEIKDQNGLDLTDCFKKKTIVKGSINYTVYYFEIRNCLKNFKIVFKFEA